MPRASFLEQEKGEYDGMVQSQHFGRWRRQDLCDLGVRWGLQSKLQVHLNKPEIRKRAGGEGKKGGRKQRRSQRRRERNKGKSKPR